MLNDLDRFHLVIDVIDRVPGLGERAAGCASRWSTSALRRAPTRASTARTTRPSRAGSGGHARGRARRRVTAVLLDLDGVLVDSRDAICGCLNHALVTHGRQPLAAEALHHLIGPPIAVAFAELLAVAVGRARGGGLHRRLPRALRRGLAARDAPGAGHRGRAGHARPPPPPRRGHLQGAGVHGAAAGHARPADPLRGGRRHAARRGGREQGDRRGRGPGGARPPAGGDGRRPPLRRRRGRGARRGHDRGDLGDREPGGARGGRGRRDRRGRRGAAGGGGRPARLPPRQGRVLQQHDRLAVDDARRRRSSPARRRTASSTHLDVLALVGEAAAGPCASAATYGAAKKCSRSVTEPGLMYTSKTCSTVADARRRSPPRPRGGWRVSGSSSSSRPAAVSISMPSGWPLT